LRQEDQRFFILFLKGKNPQVLSAKVSFELFLVSINLFFSFYQNLEQFQRLVELYSDEPQLLDPALNDLVAALVKHIRWPLPDELPILDNSSIVALTYLRVLCLVRGYKFLMRLLPHEVF